MGRRVLWLDSADAFSAIRLLQVATAKVRYH